MQHPGETVFFMNIRYRVVHLQGYGEYYSLTTKLLFLDYLLIRFLQIEDVTVS